jgi:GNAT superfamily N-acetyltransferase
MTVILPRGQACSCQCAVVITGTDLAPEICTLREMTGVTDLERIAAQGWQGTSTATVGDWLLRAGHGFTGRANSVLPLGEPGCPLDPALGQVDDFYRDHHLPTVFQLPEDAAGSGLAELDGELQRRGWESYNRTAVMIAPMTTVLSNCPPAAGLRPATLEPVPSAAWLSGYLYRGRPLPTTAVAVLTRAQSPVFAMLEDETSREPAGVARGVLNSGWLGITAVTVAPARRRAGIGRHLMGELARWAVSSPGAPHAVYLQVDTANTTAMTMYTRLGFTTHHHYHYLKPPTGYLKPPAG